MPISAAPVLTSPDLGGPGATASRRSRHGLQQGATPARALALAGRDAALLGADLTTRLDRQNLVQLSTEQTGRHHARLSARSTDVTSCC